MGRKEGTLFNSYIALKGKPDPFTAPLCEGAVSEGRDTARANLTLHAPLFEGAGSVGRDTALMQPDTFTPPFRGRGHEGRVNAFQQDYTRLSHTCL